MTHQKKIFCRGVYRPELDGFPKIALPVYPRSSGHFRRGNEFREEIPPGVKNFVQLFWGIEGEGTFEVNGKKHIMRPGDVFYRLPLEPHRLRTLTETWEYRWVTFDGAYARDFMLAYNYPRTVFPAGPCPHESFMTFTTLMQERTPFAWRKMLAEILNILALAGGSNLEATQENNVLTESIRICKENFQNPILNVNSLAERLKLDRSTLLRIFKKKMHLTPSEYIAQLRMQQAISLLKQTLLPLKEISERSGYPDVNYFCRVIRKTTGGTPSELRR